MSSLQANQNGEQSTSKEIFGQPALWAEVYEQIKDQREDIEQFLHPILNQKNVQILLTGAGSSAFIGEAGKYYVQKNTQRLIQAIPTTDVVTHPEVAFLEEQPTLLVSFARSGNSPESVEACQLANSHCKQVHHLIITCNKEGDLVQEFCATNTNCFSIILPEKSHDKSLAMTGSFTSMLLTLLLVSDLEHIDQSQEMVTTIQQQAEQLFKQKQQLSKLSLQEFERVVFLGSGPMLGIARECHLKLQELTDGKIICKFDSFLGFRHGPRAVVNEHTLMVFLFSEEHHANLYELDLAKSICDDERSIQCLSVGNPFQGELNGDNVSHITIGNQSGIHPIAATLIGQLLGLYKSLYFGLNPDNPSVSGSISRVVKGVTIYNQEQIAH